MKMSKMGDGIKEMACLTDELDRIEDERNLLCDGITSQSFDKYKDYQDILKQEHGNISLSTLIRELQSFESRHPNAIYHSMKIDKVDGSITSPLLRVDKLISQTMIDDRLEEIARRISSIKRRIKKIDTNIQEDINKI